MNAKNRLREGVTSIIGILFLLGALAMLVLNAFYAHNHSVWSTIIPISLLGWIFLWAKNSLLEGITLGIFKIKKDEEEGF
jgi:protein-S-isoprenylcysteine O-methyltransferase Ste14